MKRLFVIIFAALYTVSGHAQFIQKGKTLEYNGNNPKIRYTGMVSLNFTGAASTYNKNGVFQLVFNQLKAGKMIGTYNITIGDSRYVLFNKSTLQKWVLTSDMDLDIILCRKNIIDNIANTYSKNYINRITQTYNRAKKELEGKIEEEKKRSNRFQQENDSLRLLLVELDRKYNSDVADVRARAIDFAYIDESLLDSLELEYRRCILNDEIDRAIEIGEKMELNEVAKRRLANIEVLTSQMNSEVDQIEITAQLIMQQIQVLLTRYDSIYKHLETDDWTSDEIINERIDIRRTKAQKEDLSPYYNSYVELYKKLIYLYENKYRCSDDYLAELKQNLSDGLYSYANDCGWEYKRGFRGLPTKQMSSFGEAIYKEAANYGSYDAAIVLAKNNYDYDKKRYYYELARNNSRTSESFQEAENQLKNFVDFVDYSTKDTIYYHLLDENSVRICDFHPYSAHLTNIVVPSCVIYNNHKYTVVEIGSGAFSSYYADETVKYPTNIYHFDGGRRHTSVRLIKDTKTYTLPNTIVRIEKHAISERVLSINIPQSLQYLSTSAISADSIVKWSLHPNNPHFVVKDGTLYTSDLKTMYVRFIPRRVRQIIVPKETEVISFDSYEHDDYFNFAWYKVEQNQYTKQFPNLEKFIVDKDNQTYKSICGILMGKNSSNIICVPNNLREVELCQETKILSDHISAIKASVSVFGDDFLPDDIAQGIIDRGNYLCQESNTMNISKITIGKNSNWKSEEIIDYVFSIFAYKKNCSISIYNETGEVNCTDYLLKLVSQVDYKRIRFWKYYFDYVRYFPKITDDWPILDGMNAILIQKTKP